MILQRPWVLILKRDNPSSKTDPMQFLLAIFFGILASISALIFLVVTIGYLLSCKPYTGEVSAHFNGKKFINPSQRPANGFKEVSAYGRTRKPDKWQKVLDPGYETRVIPIAENGQTSYTFINHSTFLIQTAGINILTDPIWSERCSPFQFAGPRRMRPPGVAFDNLPKIDLVLLSHNHYDHLDKNTIKRLIKKHDPSFIVPLGLIPLIRRYGTDKVVELDWWTETDFSNLKITATPANHFSSRGLFDRDKTLWCGYTIKSPELNIYYVGDTGYSSVFKEIGKRLGPFDLSFIPIGAYLPKWFMSPIHISPDQAVLVHKDAQSKKSVAMHFGTFPLADDNPQRSKAELRSYLEEAELTEEVFAIPEEGSTYEIESVNRSA